MGSACYRRGRRFLNWQSLLFRDPAGVMPVADARDRGARRPLNIHLLPTTMSTVHGRYPPTLPRTSSGSSTSQLFEFTKRKRWADLLVTELADAIILVLGVPNPEILYCGAAVEGLLGWRDTDVIDLDLTELMNRA